jgi:hypothetical protein
MTNAQREANELVGRVHWLLAHPVLGQAVYQEGAAVTKVPGQIRRHVAHALSSRPDLGQEIKNKLQPLTRDCPHCSASVPAEAERCSACGKFVPDSHRTMKAQLDALTQGPNSLDAETATRSHGGLPMLGQPVYTTSGGSGRVVAVYDGGVILRDPSGNTIRVTADEIVAEGEVGDVPTPGGSWGSYAGHALTNAPTSSAKARAYYASPQGALELAKRIRPGHVPTMFARAAGATLRKGGSTPLARGTRVRNSRTGRIGYVLKSGAFEAAVEYSMANGISIAVERISELKAA